MSLALDQLPTIWRTNLGEDIPISAMGTDHMFFAATMLWNHTAPTELQTRSRFKPWRFDTNSRLNTPEKRMLYFRTFMLELYDRRDLSRRYLLEFEQLDNLMQTHPEVWSISHE